ncbi:hypothetical protein [Candidatus Tisiphia endosymbiont of Parasteatoda lunata]|uniref:hypothetical protein n=1 Tax=Candidatus Tisiphia endosymbiont of Parasteatoda lunata TaxID=3066275 RepID=UPI00313AEB83
MEVLHGIWHPAENQICLWLETKNKIYTPDQQLVFGKRGKVDILLPTYDTMPVASPLIEREYNLEIPDKIGWQYHQVNCLYINVSEIKNILPSDTLRLAQDFMYWQQLTDIISEILEYELYIPSIDQNDEPIWTTYHPDVRQLAKQMPEVCCYVNNNCYDKSELLQHFFDHTVTNIAKQTGFVASINHTTSRLLKLRFWTL